MKRASVILAIVFSLLIATAPLLADSPQTGAIEGTVKDAESQPLPGITVTLKSDRGEQTATTNDKGAFLFGLLPPGNYVVAAAAEGMQSRPVEIRIDAGQRRAQDLQLAATSEAITVTSEAPLINKYDVGGSTSVEAEVLGQLTFNTRNYFAVGTMMPGAVHSTNSAPQGDSQITFNGTGFRESTVFVDGVDVSLPTFSGTTRLMLPTSALAEMKVDSSGQGAEYGRVTGGISSVATKSGTNVFHGDFDYIAQNPKWRADNQHVDIPREDDLRNSYETSLGGPILQDKLWFFAAYGKTQSNELDRLQDGTLVDSSFTSDPELLKVNAQVTQKHALSATYASTPIHKTLPQPTTADVYSIPRVSIGGDFLTGTWNWAATPNLFVETRIAQQNSDQDNFTIADRALDPSKSPHTPLNSKGQFIDLVNNLTYNAVNGVNQDYPRDQANAAATWFRGENELKFGLDWQDVKWRQINTKASEFRGTGYNVNLPGGFGVPQTLRVFVPATEPIVTKGHSRAAYAQDRVTLGDHWTLTGGLRLDDQSHDNDAGTEVVSSTDLAPRLAAVYDLHSDGKFLIKGTAGRYYNFVGQLVIAQVFGVLNAGTNIFDEFQWNPATQLYDRFLRHSSPVSSPLINDDFQPFYKDEITAGIEWQYSPMWAFEARGIFWHQDDIFWLTDQAAADGTILRELSDQGGVRDYRGLQFELNRNFHGGWVLRSNYTLSENRGNVFGNSIGTNLGQDIIADDLLDMKNVINPATGQPWTERFRYGRGPSDRLHVLNLAGAKSWDITARQSISVGGFYYYRSGQPWALQPNVVFAPAAAPSPVQVIVVPGLKGTVPSTIYTEKRGSERLTDVQQLALNANWNFPIVSRVTGSLRVEITNVFDEQDQLLLNLSNGQPLPLRIAYEFPRETRLLAGVRF